MSRSAKLSAAVGGVVLLLVVVVVVLAMVALGDSDDGDGSAQRPPGEGAQPQGPSRRPPASVDRAARQEFRDCLADQGVELPDGAPADGAPPSGFDPSDPDLQAALSACRDKLPQGVGPPGQAPF